MLKITIWAQVGSFATSNNTPGSLLCNIYYLFEYTTLRLFWRAICIILQKWQVLSDMIIHYILAGYSKKWRVSLLLNTETALNPRNIRITYFFIHNFCLVFELIWRVIYLIFDYDYLRKNERRWEIWNRPSRIILMKCLISMHQFFSIHQTVCGNPYDRKISFS